MRSPFWQAHPSEVGVQPKTGRGLIWSKECPKDEPNFGAWFALLHLHDPLPTHADARGQGALIQAQLLSLIANHDPEI
jgi:hypothetical protein